jgi:hypothetical protein
MITFRVFCGSAATSSCYFSLKPSKLISVPINFICPEQEQEQILILIYEQKYNWVK